MNAILALVIRIILLVILYLFVGWIGYTIYIDLKKGFQINKQTSAPPILLETHLKGQKLIKRFENEEILIGRDPNCTLPIDNEAISFHHAKLSFHHRQWWVEDLGSTNGSFLNETKVESPTVLTNQDQIRLGTIIIQITLN